MGCGCLGRMLLLTCCCLALHRKLWGSASSCSSVCWLLLQQQQCVAPLSNCPTVSAAVAAAVQLLYRSLRDFGLGKSSIAEGGLGLFTLAGGVVLVALLAWAKGTALRKGRPYQATLEFPLACGITVGTPVSRGPTA